MDSLVNEDRCVCRAASSVHPCLSPSMRIRLGSSLSGPLSPHAPGEAGARDSACPQPVLDNPRGGSPARSHGCASWPLL